MSRAVDDECGIRPARPDELVAVVRVVEGALLDIEVDAIRRAIDRGDVLVAVADGDAGGTDARNGRVVGACVLEPREHEPGGVEGAGDEDAPRTGAHLDAVAVRPDRRRRGVARALVAAASERYDRLTAAFRPEVRGFYEACGFRVEGEGPDVGDGTDDRLRGVRD